MTAALKLDVPARVLALALLALALVLGGASWFVAVAPKHSKASKLDTQIEADQAKLATARRTVQQPNAAKLQKSQLAAALAALPSQLQMPQLVDQLQGLANRAGVDLDTLTPGAPILGVGYEAEPITVVVGGRYFAVQKFLQLMRTQVSIDHASKVHVSGRLFDVQGFQMNQTEPAPEVNTTIQAQALYFAPGMAPVTPTTTGGTSTDQTLTTSGS
jgi:hypothetical protein